MSAQLRNDSNTSEERSNGMDRQNRRYKYIY